MPDADFLLRSRRLQLPDDLPEMFFDELKAFEYRRGPDGHISFGHPHGGHDDTVYALAWAIYAAQLKLPRDPPFDPPPPHRLGAEMVAAGEALRAR